MSLRFETQISLRAGDLRLNLSPGLGGGIHSFHWVGDDRIFPILRDPPEQCTLAVALASFPLVPFANRIRDGRFCLNDTSYRLSPNVDGEEMPLHGYGWLHGWEVIEVDERSAILAYDHIGRTEHWPWDFRAVQTFRLNESILSMSLECQNRSSTPMPCGLGHHPHITCGSDTRITTAVDHVWTIDRRLLPVRKVAALGQYDLNDRAIAGTGINNCFGGWNGYAAITDPDWPIELCIESVGAEFLHVYAPSQHDFFAVEPVTHAPHAFTVEDEPWPRLGMRLVDTGAAMRIETILHVKRNGRTAQI